MAPRNLTLCEKYRLMTVARDNVRGRSVLIRHRTDMPQLLCQPRSWKKKRAREFLDFNSIGDRVTSELRRRKKRERNNNKTITQRTSTGPGEKNPPQKSNNITKVYVCNMYGCASFNILVDSKFRSVRNGSKHS